MVESASTRIELLLMRFARVGSMADPFPVNKLDPEPYLRELLSFQESLPAGARKFATDPDHYDFTGARGVKDLGWGQLSMREVGYGKVGIELVLSPNRAESSETYSWTESFRMNGVVHTRSSSREGMS